MGQFYRKWPKRVKEKRREKVWGSLGACPVYPENCWGIDTGQRIEHYEMVGYGTATRPAQQQLTIKAARRNIAGRPFLLSPSGRLADFQKHAAVGGDTDGVAAGESADVCVQPKIANGLTAF